MLIGPVEIASIDEWEPGPGSLTSWQPTQSSLAKAEQAPISDVPPSYIQARHLRGFAEQAARGVDHSRLFIAACRIGGQCDVRAMTHVINAHLRRHSTYRNWFEYRDADHIVRHTMDDAADIKVVATPHGPLTAQELRDQVVSTPDSLHWDCFRFGIIQDKEHFTFYASIDHLHVDGQFVGVGLMEFQAMYSALAAGGAPLQLPAPGNYDDYCLRQREFLSTLTLETPEVQSWVEFAEHNNGTFPTFPLPIGEQSLPYSGDLLTISLMDEQQTQRFEAACVAAGARFIGGLFACVAIAVHELTGADTYYGLTPIDTRGPDDLTTQGWFTGLIPVTVPLAAATTFGEVARAAQESFDGGKPLASVPFERVVELRPEFSRPRPLFPMLNFFDGGAGPLAPLLTNLMDGITIATYSDGRLTYPLSTLVGRFDETAVTVVFPKNPVARESVTRYLNAMKSVCAAVAEGRPAESLRKSSSLPR